MARFRQSTKVVLDRVAVGAGEPCGLRHRDPSALATRLEQAHRKLGEASEHDVLTLEAPLESTFLLDAAGGFRLRRGRMKPDARAPRGTVARDDAAGSERWIERTGRTERRGHAIDPEARARCAGVRELPDRRLALAVGVAAVARREDFPAASTATP